MLNRIRIKCLERGISLKVLCKQADITYSSILKWDTHAPNVYSVYKVARVLGVSVEELIEGQFCQ